MPLISVVIPTYNRPESLKACLSSLAEQSLSRDRFEVVVVDDGGEADIDRVTTSFSGDFPIRLVTQANSGPASARNKGVKYAEGKFIAFTDDDCLLHKDWLSRFLERLSQEPGRLYGGKVVNQIDHNIYSNCSQELIEYLYQYYHRHGNGVRFFTSNNMALSRREFLKSGGFNDQFQMASGEDRELCDRWMFQGRELDFEPAAIAYHCHDQNLRSFIKLHYRYGRGAWQFWRCREQRGQNKLAIENPGFYIGLLSHSWKNQIPSRLVTSLLMLLSQASNAAGYFAESIRSRT